MTSTNPRSDRLRFTISSDGVERATVLIPIRLSREDIAHLKLLANKMDITWRELLYSALDEGMEGLRSEDDGLYEQHYGRGGS